MWWSLKGRRRETKFATELAMPVAHETIATAQKNYPLLAKCWTAAVMKSTFNNKGVRTE